MGGEAPGAGGTAGGLSGSTGATGGALSAASFFPNPILRGTALYTAEPSALVHDGKVYLYASLDEATADSTEPVIRNVQVFSSTDLVEWTKPNTPLLSAATFPWAKGGDLRSSHVVGHAGKFYLYVAVRQAAFTPGFAIGVAVSNHPGGPFTDAIGAALVEGDLTAGSTGDDDVGPMAFADDEGKAYLYWGSGALYGAKLDASMIALEGVPRLLPALTGYVDSPWIHKRNGTYYLSYAARPNGSGTPSVLRYATATQPTGPWTEQGLLMEPAANSYSNHQAIIDYRGETYIFYHNGALMGGGEWRRSVCVDRVHYVANENASGPDLMQTVIQTVAPSDVKRIQALDLANAYIRHGTNSTHPQQLSLGFTVTPFSSMQWRVVPGLADPDYLSFESVNNAHHYLRVLGDSVSLEPGDDSALFRNEATWIPRAGLADVTWNSFESYAYPGRYIRHWNTTLKTETATTDAGKREATFRLVD